MQYITPSNAAPAVVIIAGIIISPGFFELQAALIDMIVVGTSWMQAALSTGKVPYHRLQFLYWGFAFPSLP